jgi:MFS family permease
VGGYITTAVLSSLIGAATAVWQVGVLRAGAWAAQGLQVPARNALLADIVPPAVYGRAYGFERACDNLGAIAGPLLALVLDGLVGIRTAIGLSIIPGLLAAAAIVYPWHGPAACAALATASARMVLAVPGGPVRTTCLPLARASHDRGMDGVVQQQLALLGGLLHSGQV